VLGVALSRGRPEYTDLERDVAEQARPFLIQAYRNAIAYDLLRRANPIRTSDTLLAPLLAAGLTNREADVLRIVAVGRSNQHVAEELGISPRTVGKHLERGYRKLGVTDRSSAASRIWELASAAMITEPP
jgi:DNA-binding CsgD family transcriptional regulator